MEKYSKVSIIVPVYNVEKYLKRCVDSLIRQIYTNIEIILVNDGSTDTSGVICDSYQDIDERICVYHKPNGGLSDARNYGIRKVSGEYICFVDSDDCVDEQFIGILINTIHTYNVQIAAVGFYEFSSFEIPNKALLHTCETIQILNGKQALSALFTKDLYCNFAWNKIYKRELFKSISYPKGKKMEDLGTTYRLLLAADKIAYNSSQLYFYFQRPDSIMHQPDESFFNDILDLSAERFNMIYNRFPNLKINYDFFVNTYLWCFICKEDITNFNKYEKLVSIAGNIKYLKPKTYIKFTLYKLNKDIYKRVMRKNKLNHNTN